MSLVIKILRAKRINILSETLALGETRNYNGKVKKKIKQNVCKKGKQFYTWAIKISHFEITKHDNIFFLKFTREVGIDIVDHYNDHYNELLIFNLSYYFFSEIGDFQKIVGTFIEVVDNVSKEVEKEKMKVCHWHLYESTNHL